MSNPEQEFVEHARQHGAATREGDASETNVAYKRLVAALKQLRARPDRGEHFLLNSLRSNDLSIVMWAALCLLPLRENEAISALERVASSSEPRVAFGADMTLKEWRRGHLKVE
jgi:hypothetical protein